jgi:hypothetical protein
MNRKLIIEKLVMEGFSDKTLSRLSDNELITLSNTILKETVMIKAGNVKDIENAKKAGKTIETYESKVCPVCGMKDCKCDDKKHKETKSQEIEEWVLDLAESKYSHFTSKKDIMGVINEKVGETFQPMPKSKARKGHNGVPEFMSYDAIVASQPAPAPTKPDVDTPTKPKTPEKPTIDPYEPGPGTDPKPKALAEKKKMSK